MKRFLILAVVACSHPPARPPAVPPPAAPATALAPAAAAPPAAPVAVPDTAAGRQLGWVLDVIGSGGAVDPGAIEAHFDPAFLAKAPAGKLVAAFAGLGGHLRGMTVTAVTSADAGHVVLHGAAPDGKFALALDVAPTGLIAMLDVGPDVAPAPASMAEAVARLRGLAPRAQMLVAQLDRGRCVPLHAVAADDELALGSTFKLYVLLGLVDRIIAGLASWDDPIAVRDDWRSLPSGITADAPAGTALSIRTLAERMISISDNTAADYLLYLVGRERVEAAMRASGHANPALNIPFLGTRELFWIKMAMSPAEVEHYLALAPEPRRAALAGLAGKHPPGDQLDDWRAPRYIDRVEWFASSNDLCRLSAALVARAQTPRGAPLLDILAVNPALPPSKAWSYVGFKGGSEPGVMNATWLLRRADGAWFVVSLGLNAPHPLDEGDVVGLAHGVIDLVAHDRSRSGR